MRKRMELKIAGQSYFVFCDENEEHMKKIESIVDEQVTKIRKNTAIPTVQAVIMAACNIADESIRSSETADNLRMQMKNYLEEASSLRAQLNEAKRELNRLKQEK